MDKGISVGRTRCLLASTLLRVLACLAFARESQAASAQNIYPSPYTFTTVAEKSNPHFNPKTVAVDPAGHVYFADPKKQVICRIEPSGAISIIAGKSGLCGSSDGPRSQARFRYPRGIAIDATGNIYVADTGNNTIRRLTPDGNVTTLAGLAGTVGSRDGTGFYARFNFPTAIALDASGNMYVADLYNSTIRKVTSNGIVTTIAGQAGNPGSADGRGAAALFNFPFSIAVDNSGNVFVADTLNNAIRKITPDGIVTTWAGRLSYAPGDCDGPADIARFCHPCGLAVDNADNIYVSDSGNQIIRRISPDRTVTTLAGLAGKCGFVDGSGRAVRFGHPTNLALDHVGDLYVADLDNAAIRKGAAEISTNAALSLSAAPKNIYHE